MNRHQFNRLIATTATAAFTALTLPGCSVNNGTGNYVGTVSRIQTDGIFDMCKTWEGEIAAINMRGRTGSGSTMHFTAKDKNIAAELEDAMNNQYPVRIEFKDIWNPWSCAQGSNDIVTKVERLNAPLNSPFGGKSPEAPADPANTEGASPVAGSKKLFVCQEVTPPAAASAPAGADKPTAQGIPANKLPDVLQMP